MRTRMSVSMGHVGGSRRVPLHGEVLHLGLELEEVSRVRSSTASRLPGIAR
jgi:hypothetical protein